MEYRDFDLSNEEHKDDVLKYCSECGKVFTQGYLYEFEPYCDDECLHKHITQDEFKKLVDDNIDGNYWTTWHDGYNLEQVEQIVNSINQLQIIRKTGLFNMFIQQNQVVEYAYKNNFYALVDEVTEFKGQNVRVNKNKYLLLLENLGV